MVGRTRNTARGGTAAHPLRLAAALLAVAAVVVAVGAVAAPADAQPPGTATPTAPALPPPDIDGEWSVTRTWFRSCPRCGMAVVRTTPWRIDQSGADVRVDRGLRGTIVADAAGGGHLALEGLETDGGDVYRFHYATLYVSADGNAFEGAFGGSERALNPCGGEPPIVTCFASAGALRARRVAPIATVPTPPTPPPPATPTAPAPTPSPSVTATETVTSTATATPTARTPAPLHMPFARR